VDRALAGLQGDIQYNGHGHREHSADGGGNAGRQVGGVAFAHLEIQRPPLLVGRRAEQGGPEPVGLARRVRAEGAYLAFAYVHCDFGLRWRERCRKGG
jgi:hypothetical protein